MTLTPQQRDQLVTLLTAWYQNKYSNAWKKNFHKNMRPTPINDWSNLIGASTKDIQDLRAMLVMQYAYEEFDAHYETN